jgi:hypothetical protein
MKNWYLLLVSVVLPVIIPLVSAVTTTLPTPPSPPPSPTLIEYTLTLKNRIVILQNKERYVNRRIVQREECSLFRLVVINLNLYFKVVHFIYGQI